MASGDASAPQQMGAFAPEGQVRAGVSLRVLEESNAAALFALVDQERADLRRWLPWVDHTRTVADTLAFIRTSRLQYYKHEAFAAGIWAAELAGTIGTLPIDWVNRRVGIGYWRAAKFRGQGIVTDACRCVVDHAFCEWKLNRVEIYCARGNLKSSAIPKRLGFECEGVLRQAQLVGETYLDIEVYSMLARDWNRNR